MTFLRTKTLKNENIFESLKIRKSCHLPEILTADLSPAFYNFSYQYLFILILLNFAYTISTATFLLNTYKEYLLIAGCIDFENEIT